MTDYPAGAATSDMRKREVYGRFERICSLSIHLHEGSRESWEIEPSKLFDIYSYQTKIFYPVVSAATEEKRLRREKKVIALKMLLMMSSYLVHQN